MKKLIFVFASIVSFAFTACDKSTDLPGDDSPNLENATLLDFTGLDGCVWVIKLEDESVLEPINLADFPITPVNEMKVAVEYIIRPDMASVCMVGTIVELIQIEERV